MEIWKDIDGYGGWYQVSNKGRVRSWKKGNAVAGKRSKPHILKPYIGTGGYKEVNLCHNSVAKTKQIYRLVAERFIPNPDNKPEVNHKDGIKLNDTPSNLEWCTHEENMKHASENGLIPVGEKSGKNKISKNEALEIIDLAVNGVLSQKEIGKLYSINPSQVSRIKTGKRWAHLKR